MEHRDVLRESDLAHRPVQVVQLRIGGTPVDVLELRAGHRELHPQLGQGLHGPETRPDALDRAFEPLHPAGGDGGAVPTPGTVEVDELAGGKLGGEAGLGLVVHHLPGVGGQWGLRTQ